MLTLSNSNAPLTQIDLIIIVIALVGFLSLAYYYHRKGDDNMAITIAIMVIVAPAAYLLSLGL